MPDDKITPLRLLILEDRPEDAQLMIHELRRYRFEPLWTRVDTETGYVRGLASQPEVVLSDYHLPQMDATRALELLQKLQIDAPFIVVSGAIGEDVAVSMMRQGATDYLLKDRLKRLGPAVRNALAEYRTRREKRKAENELRASETRFYSFMNNSPALALIKDTEGHILYINNTCERAWNLKLAECAGKLDEQLWLPEAARRIRENDLAALKSGETSRVVEKLTRSNGDVANLLSFRFPFADAAGARLLGQVSVDITEQIRTQKELAAALNAKEVLLKELHHRVKNNLQIISSLLNMQTDLLPESETLNVFRESQQRVQAMSLIHERLYGQDDVERLDFAGYVEGLASDLFFAYGLDSGRVVLNMHLDPVFLDLNQAIPCGLILNELLTNAAKYAFPDNRCGEVKIDLKSTRDRRITLCIADNGVGLPPGFNIEESNSLGLKITNILTRQLQGVLKVATNRGASFTLSFAAT